MQNANQLYEKQVAILLRSVQNKQQSYQTQVLRFKVEEIKTRIKHVSTIVNVHKVCASSHLFHFHNALGWGDKIRTVAAYKMASRVWPKLQGFSKKPKS